MVWGWGQLIRTRGPKSRYMGKLNGARMSTVPFGTGFTLPFMAANARLKGVRCGFTHCSTPSYISLSSRRVPPTSKLHIVGEHLDSNMFNVQACFELWTAKIKFIGVSKALLVVFDHVSDLCDLLLAELNRPGLAGSKGSTCTQTYLSSCISRNATYS